MRSIKEISEILQKAGRVDVHVHTHLCDGAADMTVENIAAAAKAQGMGAVVLTPHFHRRVTDGVTTLYSDSSEDIFLALRDEIEAYEKKDGEVRVLLSTEADILSVGGEISLKFSKEGERALDLVTPTMNYNPLLPLNMVDLTVAKKRDELFRSGEYYRVAEQVGGVGAVLEAMYECEAAALRLIPYPCMLGHFFAAHSNNSDYSWFGAAPEHLPVMRRGAELIIETCQKKGAAVDITGLRQKDLSVAARQQKDGFLYDFQREFVQGCAKAGVSVFPGSDSHKLKSVGTVGYHYASFNI